MKKISGTKISIPHSAMLKLKQQGILNLGMVDDVAVRIANNSGTWWVFIPSFILMGAIHNANKKGTSQNLLVEAERDKEFYEKVRKLNGWDYEVNEETAKKYRKK